jgi:gliding motility-associated-like protein
VTILQEPELIPATINYPTAPVCSYENANPIITGVLGGSYSSSPAGLGIILSGDLAGVITGPNSAPGTYTVTYNYTNPNGCEYSTETTVVVNPPVLLNAGPNVTICQGNTYTLNAQGALTYQWLNGSSNGQALTPPLGTTNYIVIGTDVNGCQAVDTISVTVIPYPTISFVADTTEGLPGTQINFTNTSSNNATNFVWNFGNGATQQTNSIDVSSVYLTPGEYFVVLTGDNSGCEATANLIITIINFGPPIIVAPNVFSPNNDDVNDEWIFVVFENVKEVDFVILNRWGNVVYETSSLNILWDGKLQDGSLANDGVYFYKYKVLGIDNEEYQGHGNITLIRE